MFWRKKKQQVEQAVDEVATVANDLAGKTMIIGTTGVLLMLGAAAMGAAVTYYATRKDKASKDQASKDKTEEKP